MSDDFARLRAALDAGPTPGPWIADDGMVYGPAFLPVAETLNGHVGDTGFIAACDPDTIRALLAERDRLATALKAWRSAKDNVARAPWRNNEQANLHDAEDGLRAALDFRP